MRFNGRTARSSSYRKDDALTATIWVLYVFVPLTINTLLKWLVHTELDDGRRFLTSDLSLRAEGFAYQWMAAYVILNLIIFGIGAPSLFIVQLRRASQLAEGGRKGNLAYLATIKAIKNLYLPFKSERPYIYGDVVDLVRRVVFAGFVLVSASNSDVTTTQIQRACWGTSWAFFMAVLFREYFPYEHEENNMLQHFANLSIFSTYLFSATCRV